MTLDGDGNVIAACSGSEAGIEAHMQILKYSADGARLWVREFDGPGTSGDLAAAVGADRWGGVYAAGHTIFPPQNRDYAAVKFSPDGVQEWSVSWASAAETNDIGQDIALDPIGDVILTGNSYDPVQNENVVTIKYRQIMAGEVEGPTGAPALGPSLAVRPNPLTRDSVVRYRLPRESRVRLEVFAPDGRLVRTLLDQDGSAGLREIPWSGDGAAGTRLPAGVYFLRMKADRACAATKVNLLP
jgi:hypothetical protein